MKTEILIDRMELFDDNLYCRGALACQVIDVSSDGNVIGLLDKSGYRFVIKQSNFMTKHDDFLDVPLKLNPEKGGWMCISVSETAANNCIKDVELQYWPDGLFHRRFTRSDKCLIN